MFFSVASWFAVLVRSRVVLALGEATSRYAAPTQFGGDTVPCIRHRERCLLLRSHVDDGTLMRRHLDGLLLRVHVDPAVFGIAASSETRRAAGRDTTLDSSPPQSPTAV
ncbi:hypothetical protein QBC39DRAFT_338431 [Podospora conica]|nr:hypothetical protein QBC39DRAFT_338431 [Schizothecium conicum]